MPGPFEIPHDCRPTVRCFRECFGFRIEPPYDFSTFRDQNSFLETFFARRERDVDGGEGGERIQKVRQRPVFALHSGRMRGATWFDRASPPQATVWLLGVEDHDERHKGRRDAYDRFAAQEEAGVLYPQPVDEKLRQLWRQMKDTAGFADRVLNEARAMLREVLRGHSFAGSLADVPVRAVIADPHADPAYVSVAVSTRPITGRLSGVDIPLTDERFFLIAELVRQAAAAIGGDADAEIPAFEFPGGLQGERALAVVFSR